MDTFRLAPMSLALRVATWVLFLLPLMFAVAAFSTPHPVAEVLWGSTGFIALVYASVWFGWRPSRFTLDEHALRIVWPLRSRTIPRARVRDARIMSGPEFRREFGYGVRIGAGGLWGGFGLLKTARETFSMWISRMDAFVIVRLGDGERPLLITPEEPERFVAALKRT